MIGDAIGLQEGYNYLMKWSYQPPSREAIDTCFEKIKLRCLRRWDSSSSNTVKQTNKMQANTAVHTYPTKNSLIPSFSAQKASTIDYAYLEYLSKCRRIWAALILNEVLASRRSWESLAEEYNCKVQDLESLQSNAATVSF